MSLTSGPIRILILDSQTLVRVAFRMLIDTWEEMKVVGATGDELDALALAKKEKIDIVLMEMELGPGRSSLDTLARLLSASKARIIILTHVQDLELHYLAVRSGARGLVLKEHSPEQLRNAILKVHAGEVWLDNKLTTSIISRMAQASHPPLNGAQPDWLTLLSPREQELAWLAGDGLSNKDIAERLFISETTVRHHMTSVFKKLGVANRLELIISLLRPKKPPAPSTSRTRVVTDHALHPDSDGSKEERLAVGATVSHIPRR